MNKEEANKQISDNLEAIKGLFKENMKLAIEHGLKFDFSLTDCQDEGFVFYGNEYRDRVDERFEFRLGNATTDEQRAEILKEKEAALNFENIDIAREVSWRSSAISCAMNY